MVRRGWYRTVARRGSVDLRSGETSGPVGAQTADRTVRASHSTWGAVGSPGPRAGVQCHGQRSRGAAGTRTGGAARRRGREPREGRVPGYRLTRAEDTTDRRARLGAHVEGR